MHIRGVAACRDRTCGTLDTLLSRATMLAVLGVIVLMCVATASSSTTASTRSSTTTPNPYPDATPYDVRQFACGVDGVVYGARVPPARRVAVPDTRAENLYPVHRHFRDLFFDMITACNDTGFKGFLYSGKTCGCPNVREPECATSLVGNLSHPLWGRIAGRTFLAAAGFAFAALVFVYVPLSLAPVRSSLLTCVHAAAVLERA